MDAVIYLLIGNPLPVRKSHPMTICPVHDTRLDASGVCDDCGGTWTEDIQEDHDYSGLVPAGEVIA